MKRVVLLIVAGCLASGLAGAQTNSQIFGKATDASGGVLPGVTVTLSGPVLLQPRVAVTSESGTYQFPGLAIGTYTVRFELAGFRAVVKEGLPLQGSFNAQVNAELPIASLAEDVVVTGVSPIIDVRSTTQGARFNVEELKALPTGRDIFRCGPSRTAPTPARAITCRSTWTSTRSRKCSSIPAARTSRCRPRASPST